MKKISIAIFISIIVFGCMKNKDVQNADDDICTTYDSCSRKAPASEITAVQQYLSNNSLTAKQHCSGLFYRVEQVGSGTDTIKPCSVITVKYIGKLANGTVFEERTSSATQPYPLLGFIPGWINGLQYVRSGGKIHLYIPPTLAYGSAANGSIPANSILIFEVEVTSVQN